MSDEREEAPFRVEQIDHIELFVPNRRKAAEWYRQVLGLEIVSEFAHWADDPDGPLMISSDSGSTKLALFAGEPQGARTTAGYHRVAFRVDAEGFVRFLQRSASLEILDSYGDPIATDSVVDHDSSLSIYFFDPYGHRLEVTTYDYEAATALLDSLSESR